MAATGAALCGLFLLSAGVGYASAAELSTLHPERQTGFANGGWNHDRYKDLATLGAGKRMVVADLKGPG